MTAWTSFVFTARSTPLAISVPSSRATCRFFSSSSANFVTSRYVEESGLPGLLVAQSYPTRPRLRSTVGGAAARSRRLCRESGRRSVHVRRGRPEGLGRGCPRVGGLELVRVLLLPVGA